MVRACVSVKRSVSRKKKALKNAWTCHALPHPHTPVFIQMVGPMMGPAAPAGPAVGPAMGPSPPPSSIEEELLPPKPTTGIMTILGPERQTLGTIEAKPGLNLRKTLQVLCGCDLRAKVRGACKRNGIHDDDEMI